MKIFIISVPKQIKIVCVHDFAFFQKTHHTARTHNIVLSSHSSPPSRTNIRYRIYCTAGNMACEMKTSRTPSTIRRRRRRQQGEICLNGKGHGGLPARLHTTKAVKSEEGKKVVGGKAGRCFWVWRDAQKPELNAPRAAKKEKRAEEERGKKRANTQSQNLC